jgi:hypothetical protein
MRKALPDLNEPRLDVVSLARRGPNGRLSPQEVALVAGIADAACLLRCHLETLSKLCTSE